MAGETCNTHAQTHTLCLLSSNPPLPPPRCSWQYTSVTMTSILLRSLLPRRRCAGTWWTCARSRGRQTVICLRCGEDLVSGCAGFRGVTRRPAVKKGGTLGHMLFWLWDNTDGSHGTGVSVLLCLFVFFLLIRRKLLFWSRPYMEISCVVNCLVTSFWRAYLFWVHNANEAEPIIPVTNTSTQTSLRWRGWGEGAVCELMISPFSASLRVGRYSESNSRSQAS